MLVRMLTRKVPSGTPLGNLLSGLLRGKRLALMVVALLSLTAYTSDTFAADAPSEPERANVVISTRLTDYEFVLTLLVFLFGFLLLAAQYILLRQANAKPDDIAKNFSITAIVTGTLILIAAGYSSGQIAPALGLFGTLAGYILGRAAGKSDPPGG